ncbi:MAG: M15 family metallopeptidase [Vibrionaceae bacterium]
MYTMQSLTGHSDAELDYFGEQRVHKAIKHDLQQLSDAAKQAGFDFAIASSFRDFSRQLAIWNCKFSGQQPLLDENSKPLALAKLSEEEKIFAILRWSALPGASRHHWGTDLDVYARNLQPKDQPLKLEPNVYLRGTQAPFYQWLSSNAPQYGFFFVYGKDQGGVAFEPWHISHYNTAAPMLQAFDLSKLRSTLADSDILGKQTLLTQLELIYQRFISNICRPCTMLPNSAPPLLTSTKEQ